MSESVSEGGKWEGEEGRVDFRWSIESKICSLGAQTTLSALEQHHAVHEFPAQVL